MLEARDLEVDYGAAPAVWGVSLDIAPGELVCIVGPNGAGKSTLINALAGLHRVSAGRITMDGRDLTALPTHRYCSAGIAIVPEGRRLFTRMSVRENLAIGSYAPAARNERARTLERVCALFPAVRDKLDAPAAASARRAVAGAVAAHRRGDVQSDPRRARQRDVDTARRAERRQCARDRRPGVSARRGTHCRRGYARRRVRRSRAAARVSGCGERPLSRRSHSVIPPREEPKPCPGHPSASSSAAPAASRSIAAWRWR